MLLLAVELVSTQFGLPRSVEVQLLERDGVVSQVLRFFGQFGATAIVPVGGAAFGAWALRVVLVDCFGHGEGEGASGAADSRRLLAEQNLGEVAVLG